MLLGAKMNFQAQAGILAAERSELFSLLYLTLVSGDNNFICRSSTRQMPRQ
jgi:hypothetical protein